MQRVLFHDTIFGPIHSRRLGTSLGVNLSPNDGKVCTFDCLYCEAGFNAQGPGSTGLPVASDVEVQLRNKLTRMKAEGKSLDTITFSGNGEPTLHPEFETIVDNVIALRNEFFPQAKISVLSNSTALAKPSVARALRRVDNNILKLDSAITSTLRLIDRPTNGQLNAEDVIERIAEFGAQCVVQTMLLRGSYHGEAIDNTTPEEMSALTRAYMRIKPREVMLYSIDRPTPHHELEKVSAEEIREIAETLRKSDINVELCG